MTDRDRQAGSGKIPTSYGVRPVQPVKEFGALYEQALVPESGEELMRAGRAITDMLHQKFPDLFEGVDIFPGLLKI